MSKASGSSITEQCQIAQNRTAGHRFIVVDTPGLFDTKLAHGKISELTTNNNMLEKDLKTKQKKMKISIRKRKSQAVIQSMHLEMKLLNEHHQRDLYEVKEEAKRQEERKMRELQIREDEVQRQVQEMSERCAETQKQMQMIETERQTALKEQQQNFQVLMEQNEKL
ncbi:unnamed protein product [Mytilus edulis]|uniref:AIG1-type G domain-containing protein n=1 Tax=Mytilus edulis TaxID=6550 RepID=A0A8S3PSK9_MYTED|nr:unnamed protein product [Mytilus edulis]